MSQGYRDLTMVSVPWKVFELYSQTKSEAPEPQPSACLFFVFYNRDSSSAQKRDKKAH